MKRTLKILAIVTALCAALAISAFASYFDHCADALNELGLFRGTQNGYELDREPTRAEAATMLVRLLGAEEEALALSYTAPYTDVADWAKPYVQYLQDKGLTKGTSATTFGYSEKCTAQQYATFLLRALGYSDSEGGDFTYTSALEYGEKIGLCDWANCFGELFLRDNVAAMSYTALSLPTKSGDVDLLSKLVYSGAVADAKGYDVFFANMREYTAATESLNTAKKLSADIITERGDEKEIAKYAIERNDEDLDKIKMSYVAQNKTFSSYYADGFLYLDTGDMKVKRDSSYMSAIFYIAPAVSYDPVSAIRMIEKKTEGNSVIYTTTLRHEILTAMTVIGDAQYTSDMTVSVRCENGRTTEINTVTEANLAGEQLTQTIKYENIKTGDGVEVIFPDDLDTYESAGSTSAETAENGSVLMMEEGKLRIGITQYAPMNYYDETGELAGFETEFAKALCEKLGVEPEFVEIAWDAKLLALNSGQIDCIWNGMTVTEERSAEMEISSPYMWNALLLAVKEENASKYAQSIGNAKIAMEYWFADELAANEVIADAEILRVFTAEDAVEMVMSGEADIAVVDGLTTAYALINNTELEGLTLLEYKSMPEEYAIAFRKGCDITEINAAIRELIEDGTLSEIAKKYNLEMFLIK